MHRFIVRGRWQAGDEVSLSREEAIHAARVLRLAPGERVEILTDGQAFAAELRALGRERATALILTALEDRAPALRLSVYQGLVKADKLDWIVRKLAELGAASCQGVQMARSVARAGEGGKKGERLARIAEEAAKQCGCARVLAVPAPISFAEACARLATHELALMPWEDARVEAPRLRQIWAERPHARDIALLIGPEGGIGAEEAAWARAAGALPISLGPRILRAETAAIAAGAIIMSLWGDL